MKTRLTSTLSPEPRSVDFPDADELAMLRDAGVGDSRLLGAMSLAGWLEVGFALVLILFWNARWPLWITIAAMIGATVAVGIQSPAYLHAAFNPVTLNLAVAALATCGLVARRTLPTAKNCLRKPAEGQR